MAVGLDTGVPWVMCKQEDAPDPVVSDSQHFLVFGLKCPFHVAIAYLSSFNSFVVGFLSALLVFNYTFIYFF